MSQHDENDNPKAGKIVGGLLKKAVSLGAGAYVTAEDTLKNTLNTVHMPKELLKEVLENLMNSYTIQLSAEINFVPKKDKKTAPDES